MYYKQAQAPPKRLAKMTMLAKSVDVSKLKFSPPKTLSNQSKSVYVSYEGDKLRIQTPILHLPYGVSDNEAINKAMKKPGDADAGMPKKYDLSVSFRGMEDNPKVKELHDKMREIEARVVDEVFENRTTWLRDDYDGVKSFVAKLFTPIVKYDKNKETGKIENRYPPSMRIKVPYDEKTDTFLFKSEDMDSNELDFKSVMNRLKSARARLIIQFGGIWIAGGRYGCTWRVERAKFEVTSKSNVQFIDDDDETDGTQAKDTKHVDDSDVDEDAITKVDEVTPPKKLVEAMTRVTVEDSEDSEEEDESDEDDEDEPVPAPPPPPPAKTRKTKKTTA